jgi:hypothetical protein
MERTINSLEDVTPEERGAYVPAKDGTFVLHPELVEALEQHEAELAEIDARAASREARAVKLEDHLAALAINRALAEALEAARVAPQFVPACTAILREAFKLATEEAPDGTHRVSVVTPYGDVGVAFAVEGWLNSDAGRPYRSAPEATEGPLARRMRELRGPH